MYYTRSPFRDHVSGSDHAENTPDGLLDPMAEYVCKMKLEINSVMALFLPQSPLIGRRLDSAGPSLGLTQK